MLLLVFITQEVFTIAALENSYTISGTNTLNSKHQIGYSDNSSEGVAIFVTEEDENEIESLIRKLKDALFIYTKVFCSKIALVK